MSLINDTMKNMILDTIEPVVKYPRAVARLLAAAALVAVMIPTAIAQAAFIGPVLKNNTVAGSLFYKGLATIFGLKVQFNKASAPLETQRQTWTVANHMSILDFAALGSKVDCTFAGKGDVLTYPVIAPLARSVRYVGIKRASKTDAPEVYERNKLKTRSKMIDEFDAGGNLAYFPEGTTTDGKEMALPRAGLMEILFGEKGLGRNGEDKQMTRDVVVQPIAIRVLEVDGKNALGNDELRNTYSLQSAGMLQFFWERAKRRSTTVELTAFTPLEPKNFESAKDLINEAGRQIASIVNPGQTEFKKAKIPGMDT